MLKNKMSLGVVSILSLTLVSNGLSFAMMSTAEAAATTQSAAQADKSFGVIAGALKKARKAIDSGAMAPKDAMAKFSETLVLENISLDQVDNFVGATQSRKDHEKFQVRVKDAMAGVNGRAALSGPEFAEVLATGIRGASNDGLAWAGCGGFVAGIALIIGAVVVGVVALTKTKGSAAVTKDYENRKQERQKQYNADKYDIENFQIVIPQTIVTINGQISTANQRIAYLNGQLSVLDPNSQAAIDAKNEIADKTRQVTSWNTQIVDLSLRMAFLTNPTNKSAELAQLAVEFNTDMTQLSANQTQAVGDVPRQKKIAGTLGIVAGAAAVLGTVLVIGGKGECQ